MAPLSYRRHRFPPEIIQQAIWLYLRFTLSYRDVEELLAERGLDVSYETVRRWVLHRSLWGTISGKGDTSRGEWIRGRNKIGEEPVNAPTRVVSGWSPECAATTRMRRVEM